MLSLRYQKKKAMGKIITVDHLESYVFASLSLLFQTVNSTAQAGKESSLNVFTGFLKDL